MAWLADICKGSRHLPIVVCGRLEAILHAELNMKEVVLTVLAVVLAGQH
jgi:hypothetical protein